MFDNEFDTDLDLDEALESIDAAIENIEDDLDIDEIPDLDDIDDDFDDDDDMDVTFEDAEDYDSDSLTPGAEAAIFMDTVLESFDSPEEFVEYVAENAVEWELYGLIPNAQRALEATKTIKVQDWKMKNRERTIKRECIRIAYKKNDPLYKKYKIARDKMRGYRSKIFDKYNSKAKSNVLRAKSNSQAKASTISTKSGKDLTKRVNNSIAASTKGKNPTHAPNKSKAS